MIRERNLAVLLACMVITFSARAGVSLQYISDRRMPEATIQKIKKDAKRVNRRREWLCENISLWIEPVKPGLDDEFVEQVKPGVYVRVYEVEPGKYAREPHPGPKLTGVYLMGDTKLYCTPNDGRVETSFGVIEYMSWQDTLFIVSTLKRWSKRFGVSWEVSLAGQPAGKVVDGKADRKLREFLAEWGENAHAFGEESKDRACARAIRAHPRDRLWKPLSACDKALFDQNESLPCQIAQLLEIHWQSCAADERKRNPKFASRFRMVLNVHPDETIDLEEIHRLGFVHRPPPPGKEHAQCLRRALEVVSGELKPVDPSGPSRIRCDQRQVPDGFQGKYLKKPELIPPNACNAHKTACWEAGP